ncbi:MAG: hypothetical protein TE42_10365 [Candidatus Synechococcus spongiarum SP3]|uniref:HEAT repeat domain-containing protein n=1 Tax=Candidatus Synechococcus spongiarum SP3 TaxID=1604020 RepID=A0A0G2J3Y7_9SYNE|nr:MAG: hypothetical protein TE42_10365 [Candidatus Synechococcus spongiarum SP3]
MKTLLLAGVGIILLIGVVLLRRRRRSLRVQPPTGPQQETGAVAVLVQEGLPPSPPPEQPAAVAEVGWSQPMGPQQRRQMLRYLRSAYDKGQSARLAAMEEMVAWGHPACLPLLRRGLRDADLRVVGLAARGLERFRGPRQRLRHPPRRPHRPRGYRPSPPA